jgi:FkbM family methyltransferase
MFTPLSMKGKLFRFYLLFPAHPSKIRIQNFLGRMLFPKGIKVSNEEGVVFGLDANDWITRELLERGNYETLSLVQAKKILQNGGTFVDVGANFGLYTCTLAQQNKTTRAYAIEPNYQVLSRLISNIRLNRMEDRVHIFNAAVTDTFQVVFLELPAANNLGSTVASLQNTGGLAVMSCSLAYIAEVNNIQKIDLLKIDIEGNEFVVLEKFPFDKIPVSNIILEFNFLSKISFEQLKAFFDERGFDFFTVEGNPIIGKPEEIPENNIWIKNRTTLL